MLLAAVVLNPVPVMVTIVVPAVPVGPLAGVKDVIVGGCESAAKGDSNTRKNTGKQNLFKDLWLHANRSKGIIEVRTH